jgi:hypothetical protein
MGTRVTARRDRSLLSLAILAIPAQKTPDSMAHLLPFIEGNL